MTETQVLISYGASLYPEGRELPNVWMGANPERVEITG